jgi:hypothetical protein
MEASERASRGVFGNGTHISESGCGACLIDSKGSYEVCNMGQIEG